MGHRFPAVRSLSVLALASAMFLAPDMACAATYTYTNNSHTFIDTDGSCRDTGGPGNYDWDDSRNWAPPCQTAGPPGPGDTAVVTSGVTLHHDVTVAGLNFSAPGGTGALNGSFTITITNSFNWANGSITANVVLTPTCTAILTGVTPQGFNNQVCNNLTNQGTLIWQGPGAFSIVVTNSGTIDLQADGTFGNGGGLNNSGTIKKTGGSGVTQTGTHGWTNNATGVIDVETGVLELDRDPNNPSDTFHDGTTITGAGRLVELQSIVSMDGTIHVNGTLQLGDASSGPGIGGSFTLAGTGHCDWLNAGISGDAATFAPGFTVNVSGPGAKNFARGIYTNAGTLNWLGGTYIAMNTTPFINNGTFNATAAGTPFGGVFNNNGILNTFPGGMTTWGGPLNNSGTINVGGLGTPGIFGMVNTGLAQSPSGTVNMDIGGTIAGTQFDQLQALSDVNSAGRLQLGGTLNVRLANGFHPTSVNSFQIVKAFPGASISGTFATITSPFHASYTTNDVTLSVPPPAPTISGFSPGGGPVGSTVTITGSHFSGATMVHFASTMATSFSILSDTQIRVTVPSGATSGKISVITPGGTATSSTNFTVGFIISGRIANALGGVPGVRVVRSGSSTVVYTNSNGEYSFNGLAAGTYTITPSLSGYLFTPTSKSVTLSTANVTQNFTATAQGHSISGRVVTPAGAPVAGVRVVRNGSSIAAVTNAQGYFTFANVAAGSYILSASLSNYTLTPATLSVTVSAASSTSSVSGLRFIATPFTTVSGRVVLAGTSTGLANVRLIVLGPKNTITVLTNSSGGYSFAVAAGTYTLIPSLSGYSFTPASRTLSIGTSAVTVLSFAATHSTARAYYIHGRVHLSSGVGVANVRVTRDGGSGGSTLTNANGDYYFAGLAAGTYNLSGLLSGFTFSPLRLSETISTTNINNADFVATHVSPQTATAIDSAGDSAPSRVRLSSANASAGSDSITLRFNGALDAGSASDASHYAVTINDRSGSVEAASYNSSTQTVVLSLTPGSLHVGAAVSVSWSQVLDAYGQTVAGQSALLSTR